MFFVEEVKLFEKINVMWSGKYINVIEDCVVLYVVLCVLCDVEIMCDGKNVVFEVWGILDKIKDFFEWVWSGKWIGVIGKVFMDVVVIGIGGSFLGLLFVYNVLEIEFVCEELVKG